MKSNFIAREGETNNNGDRQQRNYWLGFFGQSRCNRLAAGPEEIGRRPRVFPLQMRPRGDLERMGLVQLIGPSRIFGSRHECIEAYRTDGCAK